MTADEHYLKRELYELVQKESSIFEFLQQGSLDGVWYWDIENPEAEWMSPRFWELLGYDYRKMKPLASEWQDLVHPDDLQIALSNFSKHCEDSTHPYDQLVRYYHKDGSTIWVRCRGMAIRDDTGKPVRMLGAHTDLTQLKRTEEDLKKSNNELIAANKILKETQAQLVQSAKLASIGQIAAGLAHEINQPLATVLGKADLTKLILEREQGVDKEVVTENLDMICSEIVRASKIIKHLKTFSRQDKLSERVEIDINWLINESFVLMSKTLHLEGVNVEKELTEGLPHVLCDYVQIEQVFTNLIRNATDALKESTEKQLVMCSYQRDDSICIEVRDTGRGISETAMENVFDPFFTTKPVGQGTGLGLSISHGIIREHNGTLDVKSKEGEGTCFTITLPIAA